MSTKVAIVGASGYGGAELIRLLQQHDEFEISHLYAQSNAGQKLAAVHPQFNDLDFTFQATSDLFSDKAELTFLALPSGLSGKLLHHNEISGKVIDLSADFRFLDKADWTSFFPGKYYGVWTYGLVEMKGQKELISATDRIANPGCYATAASLSLLPAIASEILKTDVISLVAASGTTGAGRNLKTNLLNSEANNNLSSYKAGGKHQHIPEIEQTLNMSGDKKIKISFIPILAPMPRGILLTANFQTDSDEDEIRSIYTDYFKESIFVKILESGESPHTRSVLGSNSCNIGIFKDTHTNQAQVIAAIDNLGKGAAGQAIQNANLMFGFNESMGLSQYGIGA
jgi:N-acetyl-gamma-glutamyl-phosphate reductase